MALRGGARRPGASDKNPNAASGFPNLPTCRKARALFHPGLPCPWRKTIAKSTTDQPSLVSQPEERCADKTGGFGRLLADELLPFVVRPGQYLGNEWGAARRPWQGALVRLALAFPDIYELGMSNFGQRILYQIVNNIPEFLCDRAYAPQEDMEELLRRKGIPLWGWESRRPIADFDLLGFSLQYELTYTNVLNMLELAGIPLLAEERKSVFPLVFGGGPSAVNPEPMAMFLDFFIIGDGEEAVPAVMRVVRAFKERQGREGGDRQDLLAELAASVPGVYVPRFYEHVAGSPVVRPTGNLPERVIRQVCPLNDENQPTGSLVPYLSLVHDRQVLEVRRGCDRGCRFCQPGYTFLPVRERSADDLVRLSKEALDKSGHNEYSMLSLCVSDYTALTEATRALNLEHRERRASMSFPSQRADRMNFDIAEELKTVRKSGITLAPEAGSERLRKVINKGLNHEQIISAITTAYQSGWTSVKLYFMLGLPTERDEDLKGIVDILKEGTEKCRALKRADPGRYRRLIEFTCTLSNFVPKPFTPFQWFGQIAPCETSRRQNVLRSYLKESGLRNVTLNFTDPFVSLLEAVISRGDRQVGALIATAFRLGAKFDAWEEKLNREVWLEASRQCGLDLEEMACRDRPVGSRQPWDIVHAGLMDWWLVNEWKKATAVDETAPCTENTCHACGICTELDTTHLLAAPKSETRNPFVKGVASTKDDQHPSLFFMKPPPPVKDEAVTKIRFQFSKVGELRFISHLDLQHLWQRAARRASIAVAFSEGFNPSPKIALAVPLPLFQEGLAEVGEIELSESISADEFIARINAQLPEEVRVTRAKIVEKRTGKASVSLNTVVGRAFYRATASPGPIKFVPGEIKERVAGILAAPSLEITATDKAGKEAARDIRSGIFTMRVLHEAPFTLELELAAGPRQHVKPGELLSVVSPEVLWHVVRTGLATPERVPLFDLP